jgi:hypothetical protein
MNEALHPLLFVCRFLLHAAIVPIYIFLLVPMRRSRTPLALPSVYRFDVSFEASKLSFRPSFSFRESRQELPRKESNVLRGQKATGTPCTRFPYPFLWICCSSFFKIYHNNVEPKQVEEHVEAKFGSTL